MNNKHLTSGLYIVATPIGNYFDISLRALEILSSVDYIICEDTRVTDKLLDFHRLKAPLKIYNDHSSDFQRKKIIDDIKDGKAIALVSDAGTPLISDPGYQLVSLLHQENLYCTTIPGACSLIAALTISGMPTNEFSFYGFLPNKDKAKENFLMSLKKSGIAILFESAKRLVSTLRHIFNLFGEIEVAVVREISKNYECVNRERVSELIIFYDENLPRGEIIILLDFNSIQSDSNILKVELVDLISSMIDHMSVKDIARNLSKISDLSKNEIYEKVIKFKNKQN